MPEMLELMNEERIFKIFQEDGKFWVMEECDENYSVDLTADQLRQLGQEIIDLANGGTNA
jgi:hypothetical protein